MEFVCVKIPNTPIYPGFELAVRESQFADLICLFADHFKQFLWNSGIKTFLLLEFLSSGKPQSFCLHSSSTNRLYLTPKSVKLYTIFLHLDSILAPNPQWGLTALPPYPLTLQLLPKPSRIASEKIIWTLIPKHCSTFTTFRCIHREVFLDNSCY